MLTVRRLACAALVALFTGVPPAAAAARDAVWSGEWLLGTAVNASSRLTIEQGAEPPIRLVADWATRPFRQPLYWSLRVGRAGERHAWYLDLNHHKLYLENRPPEVQAFTVTHGLNLLSLQHAWLRGRWRWFALAGVAVAHAENTVRGAKLPETGGPLGGGYRPAGPVIGAGAGGALPIASWLDLSAEVRLTHAWLHLKVAGGEARTRDLALHLLVGPRLRF